MPQRHSALPLAFLILAATCPPLSAYEMARFPPPTEWQAPAGAPSAPGDRVTARFMGRAARVGSQAPAIAEFNRTALPGESFTMTGVRFTLRQGEEAGSDTTVWVWSATPDGGRLVQADLWDVRGWLITASLPDDIPPGMYFVWAENAAGISRPVCLNRTMPQWIGPCGNVAQPGQSKIVFGKNLSQNHGEKTAFVYLRPIKGGEMIACRVPRVEPYSVAFTVPKDLSHGEYEAFVHNGNGGAYGWGEPLPLDVQPVWKRGQTEVALKPSGGDDTGAIVEAVRQVAEADRGGTVRLAPGTFHLTAQLDLPGHVRLAGAGKDKTTIEIRMQRQQAHGISVLGPRVELSGFTLVACEDSEKINYPVITDARDENEGHHRYVDLRVIAEQHVYAALGIQQPCGEVTGCEFLETFLMQGPDAWVHDNVFYGGRGHRRPSAIGHTGPRCVLEENRIETKDWPVGPGGNRNYMEFLSPEERNTRGWAARMLLPSCGRYAYIAHNEAKDVESQSDQAEMILFHEQGAYYYGQVARNSGRTLTIRTDGQIDGKPFSMAGAPPITSVPDYQRPNSTYGPIDGRLYVYLLGGTGVGQFRRIESHTATTVTVERPWRVEPDATSFYVIMPAYDNHIVYNNVLAGFPKGYELKSYCNSIAIDLDGNCLGCSIEKNKSYRTRSARMIKGDRPRPSCWNEMRDEEAYECYWTGDSMRVQTVARNEPVMSREILGPVLVGNIIRGGRREVTARCVFLFKSYPNPIFYYAPREIAVGNVFENITGVGRRLADLESAPMNQRIATGIEEGNLMSTLFRRLDVTLDAGDNAAVVYPHRFGRPILAENSLGGSARPYGTAMETPRAHRHGRGVAWQQVPFEYTSYKDVDFGSGTNRMALSIGDDLRHRGYAEIRIDSPNGPLLGKISFDKGGVYTAETPRVIGKHDINAIYCSEAGGASMYLLDWIEFAGPNQPAVRVEAEEFDGQGVAGNPMLPRPIPLRRVARLIAKAGGQSQEVVIPVANAGVSAMEWTATSPQPWIQARVADGSSPLRPGQTNGELWVSVDAKDLRPGTHRGTILIEAAGVRAVVGVLVEIQ